MSKLFARSLSIFRKISSPMPTQGRQMTTSNILRESVKEPGPSEQIKRKKLGPYFSWKSLAISTAIGSGLLGYMYYLQQKKDLAIERERRRQLGKAKIGGSFELVDPDGKLVKSDDFKGNWAMIYFGFTHCPDICPDEIEKMVGVVEKLEKEYNFKLQPIFISVDPARDTPKVVGQYCREFSPKVVGLTGSDEQVAAACKAYRIYYSNSPKDTDNDYIVDHTIIMYLVDPDGLFVDYYGQTQTVDQIAGSIMLHKIKLDRIQNDSWLPALPFGKTSTQPA